MSFVDLHNHVLPGIDDGPQDLDGAIALLRAAWDAGIRRLAATPHRFLPAWPHSDPAPLRAAMASLRAAMVRRANEPALAFLDALRIDLGAEHHLSTELLRALDRGELLGLNDSRYVLVELSPYMAIDPVANAVERLRVGGFTPVIAHVERYGFFAEGAGSRALDRLVELGCVLQLNAETVLRRGRRDPLRDRALDLVRRRVIRVVASDAHAATLRPPLLDRAFAVLRREVSEEIALACVRDDPARILDDQLLDR